MKIFALSPSTSLRALCLGVLALSSAQFHATAQDAKTLFDQAQVEGDPCKRFQLVCQAANLDGKKKDYRDACTSAKSTIVNKDQGNLDKANDALGKSDYRNATRWANFVCAQDPEQFAKAQKVLHDVEEEQKAKSTPTAPPPSQAPSDQSAALLDQATNDFKAGKFDEAASAASRVTDPSRKQAASDILQSIDHYKSAMSTAALKEQYKDYAGAAESYRAALQISHNGPGAAAAEAHLPALDAQAHPAAAPPTTSTPAAPAVAQSGPKPAAPNAAVKPAPEDPTIKVTRLMAEADGFEKAGKLPEAMKSYNAVLALDANNAGAKAGKDRLSAAINSDPHALAASLALAIRDFYASKFALAEDELGTYLSSTNAKSPGAAHFYLGATRLSRAVIEGSPQAVQTASSSPEVQNPFKQARSEQYKPLEKYVSPVVMKAWQSSH